MNPKHRAWGNLFSFSALLVLVLAFAVQPCYGWQNSHPTPLPVLKSAQEYHQEIRDLLRNRNLDPAASPIGPLASQNLVANGDFGNELMGWHPGTLDPGSIPGYPQWGTHVDPVRGNPSAFLDVPGGAFAYLDSDFFFMPSVGSLTVTLWGHHDPVVLGVQVRIEGGPTIVLDDIDPPKWELAQTPVTNQYVLGTNVAGRNIAVRFVCRSEPSFLVGTFCDYDDVSVTTNTVTTKTSGPLIEYPILHGTYVDVEWSKFRDDPDVAIWAQRTADAQYQYLAGAQGVPSEHMRSSLVRLDWGIGGWANNGEVGLGVDWFFGKNPIAPPNQGPSAGMSRQEYSLQRLDAELYHEIAHNMAVPYLEGYRPGWFTEALGTWAQSSVTQPGAYTSIKPQMEDVFWGEDAYAHPDPFAGYGRGALFLWWLIEDYGVAGLHKMVSQCFGWQQPWSSDRDIDVRGFIPWTGKERTQLAKDFENKIRYGWRANITLLVNKYAIPEFASGVVLTITTVLTIVILNRRRFLKYLGADTVAAGVEEIVQV
jgi:hypothetical protein